MLEHLSKALYTVLNDETPLSSDNENKKQKSKEQIYTEICKETDALEPMKYGICVDRTCNKQDNDCDSGTADSYTKQFHNNTCHEGVATEKVVAVPANRAKSANRSITRPNIPSA